MNKVSWKKKINKAMRDVGSYNDCFAPTVDTLSDILAKRDQALAEFEAQGGNLIEESIGSTGNVVKKHNPLLTLWKDLNAQALTYWRELGLTPAGLKKLNEQAVKIEAKKSALERALDNLGA